MTYELIVFNESDEREFSRRIDADDEVRADAQGYQLCYQSKYGHHYDVIEVQP